MADLPLRRHQAYVVLAAAVVAAASEAPRVLAAAGALPGALRPFIWSDLLFTYDVRGIAGGHLPYFDVFFEYPPLMGYLAGIFSALFDSPVAYTAAWAAVVVASAAAIAYLLVRERGVGPTLRGWILAPQPLLLAGLNADLLPVALLLLGAVLARRRRPLAGAAALALGAAAKLFPAVAAPVLVLTAGRTWLSAALVFAAATVALSVPALVAPHSAAAGLLYYAVGYQAGGIAVWGLVAASLEALVVPAAGTVLFVLTTAGLAFTYLLLVVPRARAAADPAVAFGLATIALLLWARLYSPQFSLWALPFATLLRAERSRAFLLLAAADTAVFLTASPLTLVRHEPGEPIVGFLVAVLAAAVVLRHVALIGLWRAIARRAKQPGTP